MEDLSTDHGDALSPRPRPNPKEQTKSEPPHRLQFQNQNDHDKPMQTTLHSPTNPSSRKGPTKTKTKQYTLEHYIRTSNPTLKNQPTPTLFAKAPLLSTTLPNRILYYYGCFNPPHIAHLNLLRYLHVRTHDAFNVVAAIVVIHSDARCRAKLNKDNDNNKGKGESEGKGVLYGFDKRKEMWQRDIEFPEWACVMSADLFGNICGGVERAAAKDGVQICFVQVRGPDYVSLGRGVFGYDAREEVMNLKDGLEANEVPDFAHPEGGVEFKPDAIYTCRRTDKASNVIFVPTAPDSPYRKYVSSTMIREMMSKNVKNPKENKSAMASLVLGPNRKPSDFAAKIEDVPKKAVMSARAKMISKQLYESSIFL
ncbi:hypothetical protein BLS_009668 [Venturia inaequalis]|uniref:Cytidyltransferase-like domain-containing protein n=1 Tax=Venturia inaequalis TaxID=5025 RepID=A0A8H3YZ60_VENIN|nr:hypothetical protein BLS_009668 [Venturia inaequalis]